eukprot:ANDGO_03957.mRNA.1 hypothetical protein
MFPNGFSAAHYASNRFLLDPQDPEGFFFANFGTVFHSRYSDPRKTQQRPQDPVSVSYSSSKAEIQNLCIDAKHNRLASIDEKGCVQLYSIASASQSHCGPDAAKRFRSDPLVAQFLPVSTASKSSSYATVFLNDECIVSSHALSRAINIQSAATGQIIVSYPCAAFVSAVAIQNGTESLFALEEGQLVQLDSRTGLVVNRLNVSRSRCYALAVNRSRSSGAAGEESSSPVIAVGSCDKTVHIVDPRLWRVSYTSPNVIKYEIKAVRLCGDAEVVVCGVDSEIAVRPYLTEPDSNSSSGRVSANTDSRRANSAAFAPFANRLESDHLHIHGSWIGVDCAPSASDGSSWVVGGMSDAGNVMKVDRSELFRRELARSSASASRADA